MLYGKRCLAVKFDSALLVAGYHMISKRRSAVTHWLAIPLLFLTILLPMARGGEKPQRVLKAGIIGCDTSHVTAFTKLLNNPKNEGDLAGVSVVAAFPGGS